MIFLRDGKHLRKTVIYVDKALKEGVNIRHESEMPGYH